MMGQIVCKENVHNSDFINHLTCDTTGKLFLNPVQTHDGRIYEEETLLVQLCNDLNNNKKDKLTDRLYANWIYLNPIKYIVDKLIESFPELEKHRYTSGSHIRPTIKYNPAIIHDIISSKQFNLLYYVEKYNLLELTQLDLKEIIKHNDSKLLTYIINKCVDPNVVIKPDLTALVPTCSCGTCKPDPSSVSNYTLLSYICKTGPESMIKTAINQGLNINHYDSIKTHPYYIVSGRWDISSQTMGKYMIDKGLDLLGEFTNGEYKTLLEYVIKFSSALTDYALNKLKKLPDKNGLVHTLIIRVPNYDDSGHKKALIARLQSMKVPYPEPIYQTNDIKKSKDNLHVNAHTDAHTDALTDASPITEVN